VVLSNSATGNTVGGTATGAANVISGNGGNGVYIRNTGTSANVVLGNLIGTDKSGTAPLGNGANGVAIVSSASANTVGGSAAGSANVISGNSLDGVYLTGNGTSGNVVLGNRIGTDKSGTANLGNAADGVFIDNGATANTIGGTASGAANLIGYNAEGVVVGSSPTDITTVHDSILGNRIFANAGPGIDLGNDGPTPNGKNPRPFPNDGQNTPVLTRVTKSSVSGTLTSQPSHTYRLEFFASPAAGPTFQGMTFLGFKVVTITSSTGKASFTATLTTPVVKGQVVTATATDLTTASSTFGDTSEFSAPAATTVTVTSSPTVTQSPSPQTVTLTALAFSGPTPATGGTVTFTIVGLPGSVKAVVNANGQATASFVVPGGTAPGSYTIVATYKGTGPFGNGSSDPFGDGTLTVLRSGPGFGF
jgi:hypothetical protein